MDFDKIGGRKFVAFLVATIAGVLTHALSSKGLTAEVTALLIGLVGTFSASNAFTTAKELSTRPASEDISQLESEPVEVEVAPAPEMPNIMPTLEQLAVSSQNTNKLLAVLLQRIGGAA